MKTTEKSLRELEDMINSMIYPYNEDVEDVKQELWLRLCEPRGVYGVPLYAYLIAWDITTEKLTAYLRSMYRACFAAYQTTQIDQRGNKGIAKDAVCAARNRNHAPLFKRLQGNITTTLSGTLYDDLDCTNTSGYTDRLFSAMSRLDEREFNSVSLITWKIGNQIKLTKLEKERLENFKKAL